MNDFNDFDVKEEQNKLYKEYKEKLAKLKKIEKEKQAVGQVFTKGLLPLYVLYVLSLGATNGNDIARKIGEKTHGLWVPSTGGIYPLLKKMEKSDHIIGMWDDENKKKQKIYTITNLGIKELENKKELLKSKISEALEVFKIIYSDLYE
jgi:DNA-binding PadR family transcriptional regulator